jgi:integrase
MFENFLEAVDPLTALQDLTRADWKQYLMHLEDREQKLKPGTINRHFAAVSGALRSAGEYFPLLSEWRPPTAPWLPEPPGRDRLLSKKEIAQLLAALRSGRQFRERDRGVSHRYEVHDLFRLMLLTAAREGELLNLSSAE